MPNAAGRRQRADLDELLSNVSAAPARADISRAGADGLWRLFSGQEADCAPPPTSSASNAHPLTTTAWKSAGLRRRERYAESWDVGAALEALATVDAEPTAKPADVSLRCIAPQLAELIEPAEQPVLAESHATALQQAIDSPDGNSQTQCSGLSATAGVAKSPQPRTAKPPISSAGCREIDPALARVIEAWPKLPRAIQAAIRTLAETGRTDA